RVTPRLLRLDRPRIPRAIVGGDGMHDLIVVGPAHSRARGNLDALWLERHGAHFRRRRIRRPRRPFAAAVLRRRLTSPPEIPAQRKRNRELEPAADSVDTT